MATGPSVFLHCIINSETIMYWVFRYAGDHYGANRHSGREISNSGREMCTHHIVSESTGNKARNGSA